MMKRWEWSLWMDSALSYKKPLPQQHGVVACDIKRSICVNEVIKMSLTVLRINEDTQDFSKPCKQPLYTVLPTFSTLYLLFLPLFISSCETGSLRTWYARQAPCWGSPKPEEVLPNTFVPSWTGCLSQPYIISHKNLGFPSRLPTIFFFT